MAVRKPKTLTFEQQMEQLEGIASQMEHGELPLDDLLRLYEEGMKLSSELSQKLDAMEGRMSEIKAGVNGEPEAVPSDVADQDRA